MPCTIYYLGSIVLSKQPRSTCVLPSCPEVREGLMRGVHLAGWVDAGGTFQWASPCSCHCQRSGAAWRSRAQTGNHTEAINGIMCVCIGHFGLLNLEATLLSVIAHLPEIPPRTMIWAWITFTDTAICLGAHLLWPPKSSMVLQHQLLSYLFKNCQNKTTLEAKQWKGFSARPVFSQHAATAVLCMTWQHVGLCEGKILQMRWDSLLR